MYILKSSVGVFSASLLFCVSSGLAIAGGAGGGAPPAAAPADVLIVGGPLVVNSSGATDVHWILPGVRPLDPAVFGTPQEPLGFEDDVGVPINMRLTNADGTAWTTTAMATPFSDSSADITGTYNLQATDVTLDDTTNSQDAVTFTATFTSPDNANNYRVISNRVLPVGPAHTFLGGVGTNFDFHGITGIGTKLMPTMPTLVSFWGVGSFEVNGEVVSNNRLVHLMVTCQVRDEDYNLVFEDDVDCTKVHTHVILANVEITPNGPVTSPLPTNFFLPNGMEQPFAHIMYETIQITAP